MSIEAYFRLSVRYSSVKLELVCHLVRSGVAVLLRFAWVVTELAYRGPRLLAVVGHVC